MNRCRLILGTCLLAVSLVPAPTVVLAETTCSLVPVEEIGEGGALLAGDGARIAYLSDRDLDGEELPFFGTRWLFLWDAEEGSRLITEQPGVGPAVSDDGRRIVWYSEGGISLWSEGEGIARIAAVEGHVVGPVAISGDGRRIAFPAVDPLGMNPDGNEELFLWDEESGVRQVTHTVDQLVSGPALDRDGDRIAFTLLPDGPAPDLSAETRIGYWDEASPDEIVPILTTASTGFRIGFVTLSGDGRRVAFSADTDPLGSNRDRSLEAFLWDRDTGLRQLTRTRRARRTAATSLSGDGRRLVLESNADLTGTNPLEDPKIFLWDEDDGLTQVSLDPFREGFGPGIATDGERLAFVSRERVPGLPADTGEIVIAGCGEPPPPPGLWLESAEVPGFRFKVEIEPRGGAPVAGAFEPACIPETVCVSGAVPGRVEAFLRVVGPKPNGRLWPTLAKFSTSRIDIWIEQIATGEVRHRVLHGAQPGLDVLFGLVDREGFVPVGGVEGSTGRPPLSDRSSGCVIGDQPDEDPLAGPRPCPEDEIPDPPAGPAFTSEALPDFLIKARITPRDGEPGPVAREAVCVSEALCVSGAVPGRSELFVRVIGPRPNGRLWPHFVRFSTSRLEIWLEQISTGTTRYYRLEAVDPGGDTIPGLFDRYGFAP